MHDGAFSSVQVNGFSSLPFPVQGLIRHGCPISMPLLTSSSIPLFIMLYQNLRGIRCSNEKYSICVVAYEEDLTLVLTHERDINVALKLFVDLWVVKGNSTRFTEIQSSYFRIVGHLDKWYGLSTCQDITNIGFRFAQTVNQSCTMLWTVS